MTTKVCSRCQTEKSVKDFGTSKVLKSGYRSYCKACDSLASKASRSKKSENNNISNVDVYYPVSLIDDVYLSNQIDKINIKSTQISLTDLINKNKS